MSLTRIAALFLAVAVLRSAGDAAPPVEDYPRLIVGKWDIRTQDFEFRADGTALMAFETGTWSLKKDVLTMNWTHRIPPYDNDEPLGLQVVPIKFITPDLWEWRSPKGPWPATRIGKRPKIETEDQSVPPGAESKTSNAASKDGKSNTPLRVVYEHVNRTQGEPQNKIIKDTPKRLEVRYQRGGESFLYVFLLNSQAGRRAEVWTGLDRAGVDTVYRLEKDGNQWRIVSTEETDL